MGPVGFAMALVIGCASPAGKGLPPCYADFPVYTASGDPVEAVITAVEEADYGIDLVKLQYPGYEVVPRGNRLYFATRFIGAKAPFIELADKSGKRLRALQVAMTSCQQRRAVSVGQLGPDIDAGWFRAHGKVVGCKIAGDWWVRAMTMFGESDLQVLEAAIDPATGEFSLDPSAQVRHIGVIGRGKEVIKAFAFDVRSGVRVNEIAEIDLRGGCPPQP